MDKNTQTFILIGHPASHSLSPHMMNAAFRKMKIDATYKAIDCRKRALKKWINKIRSGEITGANVTMPYKETVIKYLDKLTPTAKKIGAVNTIFRQGNKVIGDNTDGVGFAKALCSRVHVFTCLHCIVIGSGGAARAICYSLCDQKISSLTILNRSLKHSKNLISQLQHANTQTPKHVNISTLKHVNTQTRKHVNTSTHEHVNTLFINTTPLGSPHCPWPSLNFIKHLPKDTIVFDIVTHPAETPLIKAAKKQGLKVIYGREMLLYQGAAAFERWFGLKAPVEAMKKALE
jgi:shikimate dehydrogenase